MGMRFIKKQYATNPRHTSTSKQVHVITKYNELEGNGRLNHIVAKHNQTSCRDAPAKSLIYVFLVGSNDILLGEFSKGSVEFAALFKISYHDLIMADECTVVRFTRDSSTARIETLKNDSPDKLTDTNFYFGAFYVICVALSIITYVLDLVLAGVLLYFYSVQKEGVFFALTLAFVLIPALLMTAFSLRW